MNIISDVSGIHFPVFASNLKYWIARGGGLPKYCNSKVDNSHINVGQIKKMQNA